MIRLATEYDLFDISLLAKKQQFDLSRKVNFTHFYSTWETILKNKSGGIIINEDDDIINGCLFYIIYPDLGDGKLTMHEVFWHTFDNKSGIKLFNFFEELAKNLNCKYIITGAFKGKNMEKLQKFYERKGYSLYSISYMKEV